jgi:hypothetical protein
MISINPSTLNDLCALSAHGVPVTLTSHPGNASLYKLSLWACGIDEHLWDITCCKADGNNWPMHRLQQGSAELLVSTELHQKILTETTADNRFVTAYQYAKNGERLGRIHVRPMQQLFPSVISSCSRLLLSQEDRVRDLFEFLTETRSDVFTRFITAEGTMHPIRFCGLNSSEYAVSFMNVLHELDQLLFSDNSIITKGGACYGGVMVPLAGMLTHYWETGEIVRCDISGPDMIHYAMQKEYQQALSCMLQHLRKWSPTLVPKRFLSHMYPGTAARVGHIGGHVSEEILQRRIQIIRGENKLSKEEKSALRECAKDDNQVWPIEIDPRSTHYFSQHDLASYGRELVVDEFWKNIPMHEMRSMLVHAHACLRSK